MNFKRIRNILMRIVATFTAQALAVIGTGSMLSIPIWKSGTLAGVIGVSRVVESLSRAFLREGKVTDYELNKAFAGVTEGTETELQVKASKGAKS